ncbi:CHASE3 domain-containing protein, partial [Pigmentiphaga soli]|uniref:CHASE3 domain-containing protein n=1 Tax=Pigmentiphaga soli TaxID=1007095 RepID=UPI0031F0CB5B
MTSEPAIDSNKFRRIIRRNIVLPLGMGALTIVVFVALIAYLLSSLNWVEHSERVISTANQLARLAVDRQTSVRGFLLAGDESYLTEYTAGRPQFANQAATLKDLVSDNPPQVARVTRIESLLATWEQAVEPLIQMRRTAGSYQPPPGSGLGKVQFDALRKEFGDFLDTEMRLRQERNETARNVTTTAVVLFVAASLLISALLAVFGRRELMSLSAAYGEALRQHQRHAEFLQHQAWLRTGQTELAEQVAGQPGLGELGRTILDFLSRYVGVAVGALYVRRDDGSLGRAASYGFSREGEQAEQNFHEGEGLVGQAAMGNRVIRLDDVPADYLKVTSGLGGSEPRQLVLQPIASDGVVNGVVELGFMRPVAERDLEFLQLASSSMGAYVSAALYRQRLRDALSETQQLNEELQVQQEELRTANEELEAQSRSLEESRASLENQAAELEQTNEQLAHQAQMLDQKNDALSQAQAELQRHADELQRASRYKSEFLANMSHELRTPLNSSLILAKLLAENRQGNLTEEQTKFAQTIYSSGNDLLTLINDILDISKVEAGKLELSPQDVPLEKLAGSLRTAFEPLAAQRGLAFAVRIEPGTPASIHTDPQRLSQILKNLLSNAIKFTDAGHVALSIGPAPHDGLRFAVSDSGIGIAPDQQDVIFDAFRQADGTASRRHGGTGLGLSISRDLAVLLGGSIGVESSPGRGSTFTLTLPRLFAGPAERTALPAAPAPAAAPAARPAAPPLP